MFIICLSLLGVAVNNVLCYVEVGYYILISDCHLTRSIIGTHVLGLASYENSTSLFFVQFFDACWYDLAVVQFNSYCYSFYKSTITLNGLIANRNLYQTT